jgi:transposase
MLRLPAAVRIFLCLEAADMRRGFDGLAAMVQGVLGENPLSGHLFVFRNRRGDRLKVLYWDRDGFAMYYKRLERGVFRFPSITTETRGARLEVPARDFAMILEGFEVKNLKKLRRFACASL